MGVLLYPERWVAAGLQVTTAGVFSVQLYEFLT